MKQKFDQLKILVLANKRFILPVGAILLVSIVCLSYFLATINPAFQDINKLTSQIVDARKASLNLQKSPDQDPVKLNDRLVIGRAALTTSLKQLMSEAEASQITDSLYAYAQQGNVIITELYASQPQKQPDAYRVTNFRMKVQGSSRALIDFVSQIRETSSKSFVLTNLGLNGAEDKATLTLEFALYASSNVLRDTSALARPATVLTPAITGASPNNGAATTISYPTMAPRSPEARAQVAASQTKPSATPRPVAALARAGIIVPIRAGDTIVSVPDSGLTASSMIASINKQGGSVTEIDQWTGVEWLSYLAAEKSTDFQIRAGVGYYVRAAKPSQWLYTANAAQNPGMKIEKGWTMVGAPLCQDDESRCYSASTLAAAMKAQGGDIVLINRLGDNSWVSYQVGSTSSDFRLAMGQGYFIFSNLPFTWTP